MHAHRRKSNLPKQLLVLLLLMCAGFGGWGLTGAPSRSEVPPSRIAGPQVEARTAPVVIELDQRGEVQRDAIRPGSERPVGQYHVLYHSRTDLIQGGQTQGMELEFEGPCHLTLLDHRDERSIVALHLPGLATRVRTPQGQADCSALDAGLREPVLVLLGADGRILGYRFSPQLRRDGRNIVRDLYSSLRAPRNGSSWEGTEGDAGGMARLSVACPPADAPGAEREVRWTRSGYDTASAHGIRASMQGKGSSRHADSPWAISSSYHGTHSILVPFSEVRFELALTVESRLERESIEQVVIPGDLWEGTWEPASGEGDHVLGEDEDDAGPRFASLAAHMRLLEQLVLEGRKNSPEFYEAFQRLVADLLAGKLGAEEVRALLMDPGLDPELARILAGAAGAAGTPELQVVLSDVASAGQLPLERRSCALVALVQVAQPDDQAAQTLLALLMDPIADARLRNASLYMLGTFAGKPGADPALLQQLLALESHAIQTGAVAQFLTALGNVGTSAILPTIERYLEHTDANLRAQALDALRRLDSPEAFAILSQYAANDPSPKVRAEAIGSLEHQPAALALPLLASALDDASIVVRKAVVTALGVREGADARNLLIEARDNDPAATVRALAQSFLN